MERRFFLTWLGLGFLASISPLTIAAIANQNKHYPVSNSSQNTKPILFYVACNGNNLWSGKQKTATLNQQDGPFATLERARDAIRELKRQQGGTLKQPITVFLRGGTYFLSEPLKLTSEDSGTKKFPIIYKAYPEEKPVISGGRRITNWKQQEDLWVANLPEVKTGKWYFRLLRVNNDWANRARYPNLDSQNPFADSFLYVNLSKPPKAIGQHLRTNITTAPNQLPNWQNWDGAEVHIFPERGWVNAILPVSKVDPQSNTIYVNSQQDLLPGNRFFIANTRKAIDSPGEWCLEQNTGELLYYPTSPDFPDDVDVVAPQIDRLIVLQGDRQKANYVENLYFEGLTFTDTNYNLANDYYSPEDAAIWLSATRWCVIKECSFIRLGGHGVRLEYSSYENQIIYNTMTQLGQGGVVLLGNNKTQPFRNIIAANNIQNCGKVYKHVAGVYVATGSENYIAHNLIRRMPRYGISLKSFSGDRYSHNNTIEFNEIIDTNLETSDTGAIETLGRDKQASGNIIRFNFIRNAVGMGTTEQGRIVSPYYTWGIYLDDYSSGTIVYGNIVVGTVLGAVMIHGGKDNLVANNIFVRGLENQIQLSPKEKFTAGNVICRNIFIYQEPKATLWNSNENWRRDCLKNSDLNLYWHTGDLNLAKTNKDITPEGNFTQWQAAGFDLHSLITEPPLITPLKQDIDKIRQEDLRLDRHSNVFKQLGLKPIPVERIGIKGFRL